MFDTPIKTSINKFNSSEEYEISLIDQDSIFSEQDYERIKEINNEPLVYELHREKFLGQSYGLDKAKGFIEKAKEHWKNRDKFIFLVRDSQNTIQAAIDIKSANLESAEIGYWASSRTPGIMTNTVVAICNIAREQGYKSLYALTSLENTKSQNVLLRAGFTKEREEESRGHSAIRFTKWL